MKSELKTKWVEALRSGEYTQGKHRLRTKDNDFCCLGVLCDIVDPSGWEMSVLSDCYEYENYVGTLPMAFAQDIDFPLVVQKGMTNFEAILQNMNDSGVPFSEIADYIEENL